MAEPQPLSGGLTDQAALGCCSDPDPSTKVGTEPTSPELGPQRGAFGVQGGSRSLGSELRWIRTPVYHVSSSSRLRRAGVGWKES